MLMGEAGAFRTKLAMYRIRAAVCELVGLESCLWLGVRTERYAYRKVQWVDPADIKYVKKEGLVPYIQSGPWDLDRRAFELHPTIVDIFINKKQYKQTRQYAYMCRLIS